MGDAMISITLARDWEVGVMKRGLNLRRVLGVSFQPPNIGLESGNRLCLRTAVHSSKPGVYPRRLPYRLAQTSSCTPSFGDSADRVI